MLVVLDGLRFGVMGLPGRQARPWFVAKVQSGPILSRSNM